ncbi:hypothetical protein ACWF99_03855 [Nocardia sp. NPDC055002]|uniref:hypothetical protein n=1 Tax=Nocardia sp. NPDC056952 TaxID=3345979 RepID=UPI00363409D0
MSVNIDVALTVRGLANEREWVGTTDLLVEVFKDERLEDEVFVWMGETEDGLFVRADSDYPVIFSGFFRWSEAFEDRLTRRVTALVPQARVAFDWGYPDEE